MIRPSTADLRVVHVLRVKGFVDTPVVAQGGRVAPDEAATRLTDWWSSRAAG